MTKRDKFFIWITGLNCITLLVANLLAAKLTVFAGIAVDCGIILFPISYVVGDLAVEFLGRERANYCVGVASALTGLSALFLAIAVALPAYPGWDGQAAYAKTLGFVPRVIIGSILAYFCSGLFNNFLFVKIRQRFGETRLAARMLGSSVAAHFVDSLVFETVAFFGVLSLPEFIAQASFAYFASLMIETLLFCFVTRPVQRVVSRCLQSSPD